MNLQFLPWCGAIFFTGKNMLMALANYNFGSGINYIARQQVAANGGAGAIADTHVQVRAINTYGTG